MIHKKLPYSARKLLKYCHFLDNPILFYDGTSGLTSKQSSTSSDHNSLEQSTAVLSFAPSEFLRANSREQLLDFLRQIKSNPVSGTPQRQTAFQSGWAGAFSYNAGHCNDSNGLQPKPSELPLAWFGYYPLSFHLDLKTDGLTLINPTATDASAWLQSVDQLLTQTPPLTASQPRQWQPGWTQRQYQHAFERIQHYLRSGDCYQTNLTMPFYCQDDLTQQSPIQLLESFNAPFSGYLKTQDFTLFSVSPERFIRIEHNHLETRPIKGTAPRSDDPHRDQQLLQELQACPKNQAENLMIVDLLRNDLSRHARPGSVQVVELFAPQSHANVHHLVSTIKAELVDNVSHMTAVFDAFPGGSITGAPKRRAMQIIDELELARRGYYCGSMGYFDDAGHSDFNILIRTICAQPDGAQCWGGGGIVLDSTAESEYQEILNKVQRILDHPL